MERPQGIPLSSGCYLFRSADEKVIYVGKAKVLRQRLNSYFLVDANRSDKTAMLMQDACSVEWIVTASEVDALVLENELIKAHQPRYNLRLKDDKSYPYAAIDMRQDYPSLYTTRSPRSKGVRYYGPFAHVSSLRSVVGELQSAFGIRSCTESKFQMHKRLGRPCLLADVGKCSAPCVDKITRTDYDEIVSQVSDFFKGDVKKLLSDLEQSMVVASRDQKFESAAHYRDAITALTTASVQQTVVLDESSNIDCVGIAVDGFRSAAVALQVRKGRVIGRQVLLAEIPFANEDESLAERILTNLYQGVAEIPPHILCNMEVVNSLAQDFLSRQRGSAVTLTRPQRGRRFDLMSTAIEDARNVLQRDGLRRQSDHNVRSRALVELGAALGLVKPPFRIECFDMSHLQGTNYVGSMVVFIDGIPAKREYRHFKVKLSLGSDDAGAMREVLHRRFLRVVEGNDRGIEPDLVIIDGGLPQLSAGLLAASDAGTTHLELTALAKREELLFRPDLQEPVRLAPRSEALYLVQRIRDEAHRFAITFHRSLRTKSMVADELSVISGLGQSRRERLVEHFGTMASIRGATLEEFSALTWLPRRVAQNLYDHFHGVQATQLRKD